MAPNIVNNVKDFNKLFRDPKRSAVLITSTSNMKAGLGITTLTNHRSAIKRSVIGRYIGSVLIRNTAPLFFLSCVNTTIFSATVFGSIITNLYGTYSRGGYTLLNNRATRVPNLCPMNRCSLINAVINRIGGSGIVANRGVTINSILVNLPSNNLRAGNFSLTHGIVFRRRNLGPRSLLPKASAAYTSTLLTMRGDFLGPILGILSGNIRVPSVTRVANNNFCSGVPHILPGGISIAVSSTS